MIISLAINKKQMSDSIHLKRFEYIITFTCTSSCIHCCNEKPAKDYPAHIDMNMAVDVLNKISNMYKLDSIMTFGGEPLLFPEIVCAIHEKAAALGIEKRQVITNGYWTKNKQKIKKIATLLSSSGVNQVAISVDAFHQECIPLDMVKCSAESLLESGIANISWNPCWLVAADADNPYNTKTREILGNLEYLPVPTGEGNLVTPEGNAVRNLGGYFKKRTSFPNVTCQDLPYTDRLDNLESICIEPDGNIPICRAFTLGNVKNEDITKILESYSPYSNPEMKSIIEKGIFEYIKSKPGQIMETNDIGFYTMCDMCCFGRK